MKNSFKVLNLENNLEKGLSGPDPALSGPDPASPDQIRPLRTKSGLSPDQVWPLSGPALALSGPALILSGPAVALSGPAPVLSGPAPVPSDQVLFSTPCSMFKVRVKRQWRVILPLQAF